MNTISTVVDLPSPEESIAPVTILDAEGRVVRIVPAEEFRRHHPLSGGDRDETPGTARARRWRRSART